MLRLTPASIRAIILPAGIDYVNDLPAGGGSHQVKHVDTAVVKFIAEVEFVRRPNNGKVAVDLYGIVNDAFVINQGMRRTDNF